MALLKGILTALSFISLISVTIFFTIVPKWVDRSANKVFGNVGLPPTPETLALHAQLIVGDLHADSTLWGKDLLARNKWGHVDLPRLIDGGVALQMFTTVTKSPQGQNYEYNNSNALDQITLLGLAQRWPADALDSLFSRALLQADRLHLATQLSDRFSVIRSQADLTKLLAQRANGTQVVGALLGTEGSHAIEGDLENINRLYQVGFRMMSLQHFFDNQLGGSLHGASKGGLTEFGRKAVNRMQSLGIIIDVSHSSEAAVLDTLDVTGGAALVVSHTGFNGHCESPRNIRDNIMEKITKAGGLIGVGFWQDVTCGDGVSAIVGAIRYGVDRFGLKHIALGSDWDGSVTTPIDASQLPYLTQALVDKGFNEVEIRAVMGGNMARFLGVHLPPY